MTEDLPPALIPLTPAQRARTAVVACGAVRWPSGDEPVLVPFVEQGGSLLLVVTDEQRQHLLDCGGGCVTLDARRLGSVSMSGSFAPVAEPAAREVLDQMRACHAECLDCPGLWLSQLVRLQVDLVELRVPGGGYRRIDLDAYVQAQPDWVIALGVQVQQHLNAAHGEDVLAAACALTGQRPEQVLAAELDWIDSHGFAIGLLDEAGGRRIRCDFARPVTDPERLATAVHERLARAAATGIG